MNEDKIKVVDTSTIGFHFQNFIMPSFSGDKDLDEMLRDASAIHQRIIKYVDSHPPKYIYPPPQYIEINKLGSDVQEVNRKVRKLLS